GRRCWLRRSRCPSAPRSSLGVGTRGRRLPTVAAHGHCSAWAIRDTRMLRPAPRRSQWVPWAPRAGAWSLVLATEKAKTRRTSEMVAFGQTFGEQPLCSSFVPAIWERRPASELGALVDEGLRRAEFTFIDYPDSGMGRHALRRIDADHH